MSSFLRLVSVLAALVATVALFRTPIASVLQSAGIDVGAISRSSSTGFMLQIRSDPAGGIVAVGGQLRGEAPLIANVECQEGDDVAIEVAWLRLGGSPWRGKVECRPGGSLWVRARRPP